MRLMLAATAALLFSSAAYAKPVTLTAQQALELFQACQALDGYDHIAKDGAREQVVKERYKFGPGALMAIAKNMVRLREVVEAYRMAHNAKLAELTAKFGSPAAGSDAEKKLQAEIAVTDIALGDIKQEVELIMLAERDLRLDPPDSNPIPASVLGALLPIINEPAQ